MNDDLPLGRRVAFPSSFDASVLRTIERCTARKEIGLGDPLPFLGEDVWNCYELSWLGASGLPRVGVLTLRVPVDSPRIIESKSLKLYLGGFSGSKFEDSAALRSTIEDEVSRETDSAVRVVVRDLDDVQPLQDFATFRLDDLPVSVDRYERSPELLVTTGNVGHDAVHTHLFRSICPVTGQPDWGSVAIAYRGRVLDRASVLRYLVSYRETADFPRSGHGEDLRRPAQRDGRDRTHRGRAVPAPGRHRHQPVPVDVEGPRANGSVASTVDRKGRRGRDLPVGVGVLFYQSAAKPISIAASAIESMVAVSAPSRRTVVNPVRPGREQRSQRNRVPGCGWYATSIDLPERCPSGRRSTPGKCVWVDSPSRVRIPPSPP